MCVLSAVAKRDAYGYEILEMISSQVEISESTVYPILRRLTQEGLLETYLQESSEGPPRKYYRATPLAKKSVREMVSDWREFNEKVEKLLSKVNS